jgi:prolyl-tRNA editing enzyme YbaK/EbsC (Cys-tRNA(Pro) deacylase)
MQTGDRTTDRPSHLLTEWLDANGVSYEVHEHPLAYTARETARAEGVDPRTFAKVVAVATDDGRTALVVLDAVDHVDLVRARRVLGAGRVRLLTEEELAAMAPYWEVGTLPPVPAIVGFAVYADHAIRQDERISFHAGSHRMCVRVDRHAWERAAHVLYGDLAEERSPLPAWARS